MFEPPSLVVGMAKASEKKQNKKHKLFGFDKEMENNCFLLKET